MGEHLFWDIASKVVGGLGVFLLGMKYMSEGLQAVSGDRLRKVIGFATNNRVMGVLVGLLVTTLVQSSSVTTVMVVGFVNSGIMTLMQAIGVIFGANIGTTITGWILVLDIGKHGLPILGIAAFAFLFSKADRVRYIGMAVMGIGMVFFGLELMKNGFKPLRSHEEFSTWFHAFQATSYLGIVKCALVGCIMTMIVQSSSATLGITISLACSGVIEYQTAAALVMGENIGTTITAWLASLGTTTNAKRAAYSHVLFNVFGTTWFISLFPVMIHALARIISSKTGYDPITVTIDQVAANLHPDIPVADALANPEMMEGIQKTFDLVVTSGIALTHTSFNVINVLVFLPFAGLLGKLVTILVPDKKIKEVAHLTYLDVRMLNTPSLSIVQSKEQLHFMAESVEGMMSKLRSCLDMDAPDPDLEREIFRREEILDNVQKEIFLFLSRLTAGQVPQEITLQAHMQMRIADEYESLSDYVANVLKGLRKLGEMDLRLDAPARDKLVRLHERVATYIAEVDKMVKGTRKEMLPWAAAEGVGITAMMKDFRRQHLERLQNEEVSPFFSLAFTDILNYYRRMKDHALNIAEVVAGEK